MDFLFLLPLAVCSYYWIRSLNHLTPLGKANWWDAVRLAAWAPRNYFTDEGWRLRRRGFWVPLVLFVAWCIATVI